MGLIEPMFNREELENCQQRLGLRHSFSNTNGKIWAFMDEIMEVDMVGNEEQMLTLHITRQSHEIDMYISLVYAKYAIGERLPLWESIYNLSKVTNSPWLIGGNFNVICCEEEKLGGRLVTDADTRDFIHCIGVCNLLDVGFQGSKYTQWNGRTDEQCIFERMDRILYNHNMQDLFPVFEVEHLLQNGLNHAPLLINVRTT